ncbi:LPS-assembly protein LptD [Prosthecochloris sp. N3]|uniref:LPS-assembly protein LptD n=1 Tax=Prosthecochloris ethylica TaxID=2743976 RepID=A0ABR9XU32_9CHLB|nr:putative LPS assembly protein LptD [Prosthecochloris ethylica]MBF0587032.1 LPS-assembly protein LptD [Prosthecochloris ethylica]MBF0637372.1 LPS-assembly protein LptD [Prosthecochloris ethylica]NUK48128.1 LPS-assembly protein LptD [Prosthecochloris ethylica]
MRRCVMVKGAGSVFCPFLLIMLTLSGSLFPAQPQAYGRESSSGDAASSSTISFAARDSLRYDLVDQTMTLWGSASVEQAGTSIQGPEILVDYEASSLYAEKAGDESAGGAERPVFTDDDGAFEADTITYNFDTGRGVTSNIASEMEEGYYEGEEVTRLENGELLVKNGYFTTCPKEDPDIWFSSSNMRIIPNDRLIARPLIMYVRPVLFSRELPPIPLIPLPYMVIPLRTDRASGFLIPKGGSSSSRGFYLSNLGYFWAISDYMDLRLEGDISFNGSWRLAERYRYKKRYLYEGAFEAEYEHSVNDSDGVEYDNWYLNLEHQHRFDPTAFLDLNLEYLGGERDYDISSIDYDNIVNEQTSSYASFSKTFDEGNRRATVSYQGTQDLRNDDASQTVKASYYQGRVYPFMTGDAGEGDWRSRLSLTPRASVRADWVDIGGEDLITYRANAGLRFAYLADLDGGNTLNLTQEVNLEGILDERDAYGYRRAGRLSLPFGIESTLWKHLYVNGRVDFNSSYADGTIRLSDDGSGGVLTEYSDDMSSFSTYGVSLEAETRLYGTLRSALLHDLTGIRALRHTFIPELSFSWNPDFTSDSYGYYDRYFDPVESEYVRYNRFRDALYDDIPGPSSTVGITLGNLLQAKVDDESALSGERILQLLSFSASASCNLAADSLQWSPLVLSASSSALSPDFLLSAGAVYDFYSYDPVTEERIDRLYADEGNGLLRFVRGFVNMSFQVDGYFRSGGGDENPAGDDRGAQEQGSLYSERFSGPHRGSDVYRLPWKLRMSLYLNSRHENPFEPAETDALLNTSARFSLTDIWQVGVNTGFDLQEGDFVFPQLDLYGDFNCWEVGLEWVPSGEYQSYFLQIGLKSSLLQDLRFRKRGQFGG